MMTGILIATPLAACTQDNTASDISAPQPVATKMVADASDVTSPVSMSTSGEAKIYKVAATTTSPVQTASVTTLNTKLRETPQCAPLFKNNVGRELDASFSAHDYSKKNIGAVGISIFAGQDLGQNSPELLGTALVNSLLKRGVQAECFVHHKTMPNGTGVDFKIAGLSWGKNKSLQVSEALNAEMMDKVAAEAKTAGMLLSSNQNTFGMNPP